MNHALVVLIVLASCAPSAEQRDLRIGSLTFRQESSESGFSGIKLVRNDEPLDGDATRRSIPLGAELVFVGTESGLEQVSDAQAARSKIAALERAKEKSVKFVVVLPDGVTTTTFSVACDVLSAQDGHDGGGEKASKEAPRVP